MYIIIQKIFVLLNIKKKVECIIISAHEAVNMRALDHMVMVIVVSDIGIDEKHESIILHPINIYFIAFGRKASYRQ